MDSIFLFTVISCRITVCEGCYPQIWSLELLECALLKSVPHELIKHILLHRLEYDNKGTTGDVDSGERLALIEQSCHTAWRGYTTS